jgi:aspartyl-tRNA synthetase
MMKILAMALLVHRPSDRLQRACDATRQREHESLFHGHIERVRFLFRYDRVETVGRVGSANHKDFHDGLAIRACPLSSHKADCICTPARPFNENHTLETDLAAVQQHLGRLSRRTVDGPGQWHPKHEAVERGKDGRLEVLHHPFTRPNDEGVALLGGEPGAARAVAYDLVGNGIELAGGSFRIHEPDLQARVFDFLAISPEEQRVKFGFLLDALSMGAPPHGGIASGIDRLTMALLDEPFIRETQAFPKNQAGVDPMSGAPSDVPREQLDELGIRVVVPNEKKS